LKPGCQHVHVLSRVISRLIMVNFTWGRESLALFFHGRCIEFECHIVIAHEGLH
jgi:hypothetical protein